MVDDEMRPQLGHLDHADVADTCVVGIVDTYSGEVPLAYVMLKAEAAQARLPVKAVIAKVYVWGCA
jgi:acyl-coenzyme A synthetase/AMP-(fatty) acid ligase